MTLEEAFNFCLPSHFLGRNAWIKNGMIMHLISANKTLTEIKLDLDLNYESLSADDWNIYEVLQ